MERTNSGTQLARVTLPMTTLVGITMEWAFRFLKETDTREEPGCNSWYVVVGTMKAGKWGHCAGSASMWTHIQCPWISVSLFILMVPNGGMVILHVVWTCPWTSSRQNSLDTVGSGAEEELTPFAASPSPLVPLWGSWSDPDITAPKWAFFQVVVALACSLFCDHSHHPINNPGPHHNWYLLRIGHSQYDQQQVILIVTPYTWDLPVNFYISQVWNGWDYSTL